MDKYSNTGQTRNCGHFFSSGKCHYTLKYVILFLKEKSTILSFSNLSEKSFATWERKL